VEGVEKSMTRGGGESVDMRMVADPDAMGIEYVIYRDLQ